MAQTKPPFAWQPLTPRGISAFAFAPLGRLWLVQLVVAMFVAGVVIWFIHRNWYPVIASAITELPDQGQLHNGKLEWDGYEPIVLAESPFLSIAVDLEHAGDARTPADLQAEFGERDLKIFSLLGFTASTIRATATVASTTPTSNPGGAPGTPCSSPLPR
jgi:hypothetical protein